MSSFPHQQTRMSNIRWKIFLLLLLLVSLNYIDRAALSVAMPVISEEFDLSPEMQGLILSSFFWTYLFMQVPSGVLADRFNPRTVISLATILWGACQGLGAVCTGWFTLLLTRLGLGATEAPIYPAGSKLNALWLTRNERTRGASLLDGGSALGSGLGAIVTASLMAWLDSWRLAFAVAGIGTVLCGIWVWWYIRDKPQEHPSISPEEIAHIEADRAHAEGEQSQAKISKRVSLFHFFRFRSVWCMCINHTCTNLIFYGLMTWLPSYLYKTHGFDLKSMGSATFIIFFMGFVGEICGGWIADHWKMSGAGENKIYRSMMAIGASCIAISMCAVAYMSQPVWVVSLLCVALFFIRWCGGCNWATPLMISSRERVGTVGGIMNFVGNIAGIFVPMFIGLIVQQTGSYFLALMFFVVVAIVQIISSLLLDYQKVISV